MRTAFKRVFTSSILIVFVGTMLLATARPAHADVAIIEVTTTEDVFEGARSGAPCSLREAISAANENKAYGGCKPGGSGMDYISLPSIPTDSPVTTYRLTREGKNEDNNRTGDLDILNQLAIANAGQNTVIVDAGKIDRVFQVNSPGEVMISGIIITGGSGIDNGGGIFVGYAGGAAAKFTLSRSVVTLNTANVTGGGIHISRGAQAEISASDIWKNTTHNSGGGVYNEGTVTITQSLVHENTADIAGGGVDNNAQDNGKAVITNTTISGNSSTGAAGVSISAYVEILSSVIADNAGVGLGVITNSGGWVKNTIVARQTGKNCNLAGGVSISGGHNIDSDSTCALTKEGDQPGVTPAALNMATALQPNGGLTLTYAIPAASAAFAHGAGCPALDQRNYVRGTCDVGAFAIDGVPLKMQVNIPLVFR